MPSKNTIKIDSEKCFYHIYNRGVDKRNIFEDDQDYRTFLHLLKIYLTPPHLLNIDIHPLTEITGFIPVRSRPIVINLFNDIELIAYCLMPNHFHLLIFQKTRGSMTKLMKKLLTTYSMYFNRRYNRVGHLFQGIYKASLIQEDNYLLYLTKYIHLNPVGLKNVVLADYPYSSYQYYLKSKNAVWLNTDYVLNYFGGNKLNIPKVINTYQKFIEEYINDLNNLLGDITLDEA